MGKTDYLQGALATYRGQCVLTLSYSLDAGQTWTAGRAYQLSGLADGARVRR